MKENVLGYLNRMIEEKGELEVAQDPEFKKVRKLYEEEHGEMTEYTVISFSQYVETILKWYSNLAN